MPALPLLALGIAGCPSGPTASDIAGDGQRTWVLSECGVDGEAIPIPDHAQGHQMTFNSDVTGLATSTASVRAARPRVDQDNDSSSRGRYIVLVETLDRPGDTPLREVRWEAPGP